VCSGADPCQTLLAGVPYGALFSFVVATASAAVLVFAILRSEHYLTAGGFKLPQDVEVRAARTGRHHVYDIVV
jgi:hypothetical protein